MRTERQTSSPSSRSRSRNVMRRNTGWSCSSVQALPTSTASTRSDVPAARSGECSSPPSTPRRKTAHDLPVHTVGGFFFYSPSHPRCAQTRGQLPAGQTAHERVKTVGTYRQPAAHARPQIRLGPRRQRRKTHLASPHLRSTPFHLQSYYAFG